MVTFIFFILTIIIIFGTAFVMSDLILDIEDFFFILIFINFLLAVAIFFHFIVDDFNQEGNAKSQYGIVTAVDTEDSTHFYTIESKNKKYKANDKFDSFNAMAHIDDLDKVYREGDRVKFKCFNSNCYIYSEGTQ